MDSRKKSRRWCVTVANPEETIADMTTKLKLVLLSGKVIMCVFQLERSESKLMHWQGYIEFKNGVRMNSVKVLFGAKAHCEIAKGTRSKCIVYCTKDDTHVDGPWYFPDEETVRSMMVIKAGTRSDIVGLRDAVREGMSEYDCWSEYPIVMAKYSRLYGRVKGLRRPHAVPREVYILFGEPGTGKTRFVEDEFGGTDDLWVVPIGGQQWYDGYDGHKVVLIDDFNGASSKRRLDDLLRLLDRYVSRVPVKGGYRWFNPRRIYITTNFHPYMWYKWVGREEQYRALARRIGGVKHFVDKNVEPEEIDPQLFFEGWADYCDGPVPEEREAGGGR